MNNFKKQYLPSSSPTSVCAPAAFHSVLDGLVDHEPFETGQEYGPIATLRPEAAARYIGIGLSTLWDRINPQSPRYDKGFPKPLKLSERRRAFLVSELDAWLALKAADRKQEIRHD